MRRPAQLAEVLHLVQAGTPALVATAGAPPLHSLLPATLAPLAAPDRADLGALS